jgi:hypothetical protein
MHWRGDRTGGGSGPSVQPDGGAYDEEAAFMAFRAAFPGLLGRDSEIPEADMRAFTHFVLQLTYPPNPIRNLDDSLTPLQRKGFDFFFGPKATANDQAIAGDELTCAACHALDRQANAEFGVAKPGFFGSDNNKSDVQVRPQHLKNPHLRNLYTKVGMFGFPIPGNFGGGAFMGDQVRGFGFTQDASFDTLNTFLSSTAFRQAPLNPEGIPAGAAGEPVRRQIEAYMFAFDTNLFPVVGQQVTLHARNVAAAGPRIDLLLARADARECDVVATLRFLHAELRFVYAGGGFVPAVPDAVLRHLGVLLGGITYTAVPPGHDPQG